MAKNKKMADYDYISADDPTGIKAMNENSLNQANESKTKFDTRLQKYKDPTGVSWRQLNFGLWLSENKKNLTRALTIFLILISAFFFIYSSYSYVIYFLGEPIDNQPENQVLSPRNFIQEMEIGSIVTFRNSNSYDMAVLLQNANDNFSAEFNYCFYQGEITLKCDKSYILPSEKKYLSILGLELDGVTGVTFKINDIFWSRVNRREIPDWPTFLNERINFEVANIQFLNANRSGLSENLRLNNLEFNYINNSPYSYYNVPLNIFFYNGSILVGIESYLLQNFLTGESRLVKMTWPGDMGTINRIEVLPQINILDDEVYLRYGE